MARRSLDELATKVITLHSQTITTAETAQVSTASTELEGMDSLVIQAVFTYGTGGTNATYYIQTSLDSGTTWIDVACFQFTTTTATKVTTLSANTPVTTHYTPTDGSLTANTSKDGILGDRLRVKRTTTGTYSTSTTIVITAFTRG